MLPADHRTIRFSEDGQRAVWLSRPNWWECCYCIWTFTDTGVYPVCIFKTSGGQPNEKEVERFLNGEEIGVYT